MIPEFPQFKILELADKAEVEKFTSKYPPYSDFNFVSMWCWDVKNEMLISVLNDNLVVKFCDYVTGKPFYSFLGNNKTDETIEALLELSKKEGLAPVLKLVPEDSIKNISTDKFLIKEDEDHFDYIYELEKLAKYNGSAFAWKRNKIRQLLKLFPNVKTKFITDINETIKEKILKLDEVWLKNKTLKNKNVEIKNEFLAIDKFLKSKIKDLTLILVLNGEQLIGYSIFETLPNKNTLCHFSKADINFNAIYDYTLHEAAKTLSKNSDFLNYEQDLGIKELRHAKKSFVPVNFFKKYICTYK